MSDCKMVDCFVTQAQSKACGFDESQQGGSDKWKCYLFGGVQ